ncbi:armadillo beta-catenin repeat family protein, partial [Chrysochromulina tobinii]
ETRRWAAAAIAALADDNISTRIEIAEEGGIAPLVSLILAERESASYSRQAPLVVESAVHALYHLASDEDNKLAIARLGGIPPLVRLIELDDEGTDETMEWAAAALETLARGSHENQLALSRLEAIRPLTLLCGAEQPRTRAHAAGALLCIATPKENLTNVVVPLVELLELRNPAALAIAAHLLAALAARGVAGRTAVADAGGIPSLVRMLGDGTNPAQLQIDAAACLFDLARTPNGKSSLAAAGGVSPLVQMLSCASVDAQTHAAGALWLLATVPACQPTLVNAGSIEPLVALLSSPSVAAATHAADALGQLGSGSDNKAAIIKAGSVPPLVALLSASAPPEARESAAAVLAELSRGKKDGAREAIAKAGGVELLVQLLSTDCEPILVKHAAMALWGLTSEPALHGLVARAGAMPLLVALLQSDTHKGEVHGHAAATLSNVASDPTCRHLLTTQTNAMGVLMGLTQGGSAWLMSVAMLPR